MSRPRCDARSSSRTLLCGRRGKTSIALPGTRLTVLKTELLRSETVPFMRTSLLVVLTCAVALAVFSPGASAAPSVRFQSLAGVNAPGTPAQYNRVGVLQIGPRNARNVLVLNPGTSASAAYFAPLAKTIVSEVKGWQVWAVERRENLLEDQLVLNAAKAGKATGQQLFNYYLGWLSDSSFSPHFRLIPDADVAYARDWGLNVEIGDLRKVVRLAQRGGRTVVVGGHSLGGSITTAYATWDFNGHAGAEGLSGVVYIDGGSNPVPVSADQASTSLQSLRTSSPWLSFGGIAAPFAGLFNSTGSVGSRSIPIRRRSGRRSRCCPLTSSRRSRSRTPASMATCSTSRRRCPRCGPRRRTWA